MSHRASAVLARCSTGLAALGIAAVLEGRDRFAGRPVATIVCGSNVDADAYRRWTGAAPVRP